MGNLPGLKKRNLEDLLIDHMVPIQKMQNTIASDLHDDIGSNLGSISLIARTARKDLARLLPRLRALGGTDLVVTEIAQLLP